MSGFTTLFLYPIMLKKLAAKLHHSSDNQNSSSELAGANDERLAFDSSVLEDALLQGRGSSISELPADGQSLSETEQCKQLLRITEKFRTAQIPELSESLYAVYKRTGDRKSYEDPYFARRAQLTAHALSAYVSSQPEPHIKALQEHILTICDEPCWVVPAHTRCQVDLFNAETAFALAQIVDLLRDKLDGGLVRRVHQEIDRRVLTPYEQSGRSEWWFLSSNNWNGVVNSSVGSCFLLVPVDPNRAVSGVSQALDGLKTYINNGFASDGATTEGVGYWQYGLSYLTAFLELLAARSLGKINLLQKARIATIASSASKLQLGPNKFAPFADADEDKMTFSPGFVSRLADRLGQPELRNLLTLPERGSFSQSTVAISKTSLIFRDLAWWNGELPTSSDKISDAILPDTGVARMVVNSSSSPPLVIIAKAGHNGEEHNHCDIGSFVIHHLGENLITDPGKGLYNKEYFDPKTRYKSLWARSDGHSVPVIGGRLQGVGSQFRGSVSGINIDGNAKTLQIDLTRAYDLSDLQNCQRQINAYEQNGVYIATLIDTFQFSTPQTVRSQFMTFQDVQANSQFSVSVNSPHSSMILTMFEPQNNSSSLVVEDLSEESQKQKKPKPLKRIVACLSEPALQQTVKISFEIRGK